MIDANTALAKLLIDASDARNNAKFWIARGANDAGVAFNLEAANYEDAAAAIKALLPATP